MKLYVASAALAALLLAAPAAEAGVVTLTFEGLGDQQTIGNWYNGGGGGNYGITFGSDSLALVSDADGGTGNFSNNPSGDTVAFFQSGPGDVMDVAAGFTTGFSFYYAAAVAGFVDVYSGLDGTGTLLAQINLAATPNPYSVWQETGVAFSGTAESVIFGGSANYIGFDNITLGSAVATVPEPGSLMLLGAGLAGLGAVRRRRKTTKSA